MKTLRIDFVSDVVCPWCAIGLASLEQALQRVDGEIRADLHFQPFELNPQMPLEGEAIAEHLQRKYGLNAEQLEENQQRIRQRGAELGVVIDFNARSRIWNTFDAHRLLHWAGTQGRQHALKRALLHAYFAEGCNVADRDVLSGIAEGVGLDAAGARAMLGTDQHANDVRAAEQFFRQLGITGVPAIIIERRLLVSGGQSPDVFEQALRQAVTADPG